MNISIAITNHNQNEQIKNTIKLLKDQTVQPYEIFVLSDAKQFKQKGITCINNKKLKGRCDNRNSVIPEFLATDSDALIFLDGDSYPKNIDFIEKYVKLLNKYDMVFGTREHTDISKIKIPASDLLTANMDELWQKKKLNYKDLRAVSGAIEAFQNAKTFDEKADLMLTGMVCWSCNFGITKKGIEKLSDFMTEKYGIENSIFDAKTFSSNWGYEDVAMGLDALFAGLKIWITEGLEIKHIAHERSDGLFDHVKGRHLIMNRYRNLMKKDRDNLLLLMMISFGFFMAGIITGLITSQCFIGV